MQTICTSLQADNHTNTSSLTLTGRMLFLTPNQQCQSTEGVEMFFRDAAVMYIMVWCLSVTSWSFVRLAEQIKLIFHAEAAIDCCLQFFTAAIGFSDSTL